MTKLQLVVQVIGIVTLASCGPLWNQQHPQRQIQDYGNLEDLNQANNNVQQYQDHDDILDDSQQQTQNEDLTQYQQQFGQLQQEPDSDDYSQQQTQNEDLTQYQQTLNQIGQQQSSRLEDLGQLTDDFQQSQQHEDYVRDYQQQAQSEDLSQIQQQLDQMQQQPDSEDYSQQQTQNEDLSQYQQGQIPIGSQIGRLEDFGKDSELDQQTQVEDFNQVQQQNDRNSRVDNEAESDEYDSDDSQQKKQNEDLSQYQQGQIPIGSQIGRLEDLGKESELDQQTQVEDLNQAQQQNYQNPNVDNEAESDEDDSQQKTQNEDLSQYQQGQIPIGSQIGRLEDLGKESELNQQTQVEDLNQMLQQNSQSNNHDYVDESQQTQVEDFSQGQNQIMSGRLEDLGEDSEVFQQNQQQTQVEDLSQYEQYPQGRPRTGSLQVSQIRHEQQPYSYNAFNNENQRPVETLEQETDDVNDHTSLERRPSRPDDSQLTEDEEVIGHSDEDKTEGIGSTKEEMHKVNVNDLHHSIEDFGEENFPRITTARPGFWRRFGNRIETTYNKAKDKAKEIIDTVREKVG